LTKNKVYATMIMNMEQTINRSGEQLVVDPNVNGTAGGVQVIDVIPAPNTAPNPDVVVDPIDEMLNDFFAGIHRRTVQEMRLYEADRAAEAMRLGGYSEVDSAEQFMHTCKELGEVASKAFGVASEKTNDTIGDVKNWWNSYVDEKQRESRERKEFLKQFDNKTVVADGKNATEPKKADKKSDAVVVATGKAVKRDADVKDTKAQKATAEPAEKRVKKTPEAKKRVISKELGRKLGKNAIVGVIVTGIASGLVAMGVQENNSRNEAGMLQTTTAAASYEQSVVTRPVKSYGIGGNGQVVGPIQEFNDKGYAPGNRDEAVQWSANMAIMQPGQSPEQSINEGSNNLVAKYYESRARGEHTHISSYSFGGYAAQDAAWRIYRENGNKWPSDLSMDIVSGDQTAEGVTGGPFGKFANKLLNLPEHSDKPFPPGAKVRMVYRADDPYASGGNESLSVLMYDLMGMGYGTHEMPALGDPNFTWTSFRDANGIEHVVAHPKNEWMIVALERAGIKIMDTESANKAIRALFPRNDDPNAPPPEANVREALHYGAVALDKQFGTGNLFQTMVANMPEPWKQLMDDSWNGMNNIAMAVAKAANGEIPPMEAFNIVMAEMNKIFGGVNQVLADPERDIQDFGVNTAAQQIQQYTGMDFTPQLHQLVDHIQQIFMTQVAEQSPELATAIDGAPQTARDLAAAAGNLLDTANGIAGQNGAPQTTGPAPQAEIAGQLPAAGNLLDIVNNSLQNNAIPEINLPAASAPAVDMPAPSADTPAQPNLQEIVESVLPEAPQSTLEIPQAAPAPAPAPSAPAVSDSPAPSAPAPVVQVPEIVQPFIPAPAPAPVAPAPAAPAPAPAPSAPAIPAPAAPAFELPNIELPSFPAPAAPAPAVPAPSLPQINLPFSPAPADDASIPAPSGPMFDFGS
jgi:hypothetical protein